MVIAAMSSSSSVTVTSSILTPLYLGSPEVAVWVMVALRLPL